MSPIPYFSTDYIYTTEPLIKQSIRQVLLVVDHQIGLSQLVRDYEPTVFRQSILAHAAIGKLFSLPTILTTSAENGASKASLLAEF